MTNRPLFPLPPPLPPPSSPLSPPSSPLPPPQGEGFDVMKSGDARVALIGFPSVGKVCTCSISTRCLALTQCDLLPLTVHTAQQVHIDTQRIGLVRVHYSDLYSRCDTGRRGHLQSSLAPRLLEVLGLPPLWRAWGCLHCGGLGVGMSDGVCASCSTTMLTFSCWTYRVSLRALLKVRPSPLYVIVVVDILFVCLHVCLFFVC